MDKTKIICTIGPASEKSEILKEMINKGMSIVRFNLSHATNSSEISQLIKKIEKLRFDNVYPGIAIDTRGPEVRIQNLKNGIQIKKGDFLIIKSQEIDQDDEKNESEDDLNLEFLKNLKTPLSFNDEPENKIFIVNQTLENVKAGSLIKVDDGFLNLEITEINKNTLKAVAMNDHYVKPNKKVMIQGVIPKNNCLEMDKKMLKELENLIDIVFISFVNCANDVIEIKNVFKKKKPLLYAKIESEEAVNNLQEILNVSDGLMVARGDLGIAVGFEKLFSTQNKIIKLCKKMKKPVIMATQMLESMLNNRYPTRAEVTDIGSAVINGCDCVMLSGESSVGSYPVECVEIMRSICKDAESMLISEAQLFSIGVVILVATKWKDFKKYSFSGLPLIIASTNIELLRKTTILRDVHPICIDDSHNLEGIVDKIRTVFNLKDIKGIFYHVGVEETGKIIKF
ncbi:Pyruvate kinase [Dictyocoela muelleri]|nr:Pyruvate kinase [Dictyocoela muelleri]